jgi:hypothetical protein
MTRAGPAIQKLFIPPRTRRLRRRVLLFSLLFASIAVLLVAIVFAIANVSIPIKELQETNRKTIERIHCDRESCDIAEIANDWEFSGADYVLDKYTSFFLNVDEPTANLAGFPLRHSDPEFMLRFQSPASVTTPARESWRLCSAVKQFSSRRVAVMVGYAEHASWKMDVPLGSTANIDAKLKEQLAKLEASLTESSGQLELPDAATRRITDGYEVVDLSTNEIVRGGYWIPVYLPHNVPVPTQVSSFQIQNHELYVTEIDATERFLAASSQSIGNVWSLAALFGLTFLLAASGIYISGSTFLRKYFVFSQARPRTVDEAVKLGEGLTIEFKRSISFEIPNSIDQILSTVAAFANSCDGTIFIGIEDDAKIKGIKLDGPKQKDQMAQRIYQTARQRIRPTPWIQVEFAEIRGFVICTIFVPRGDEPLYFLDGTIYVRYGPTDIKAEPEIVKKLLIAHAF